MNLNDLLAAEDKAEREMTAEERDKLVDSIRDLGLTSCDFCGDDGCCDPECWRCHSPLRPENLRRLAGNFATAAMLCRAWQMRADDPAWRPGCNLKGTEPPQ